MYLASCTQQYAPQIELASNRDCTIGTWHPQMSTELALLRELGRDVCEQAALYISGFLLPWLPVFA